MKSARRYSTEALVIRQLDYAEADRILTIYTPGRGKFSVIAKGVRRARSRRSGHLDLFTRVRLDLAAARNLDVVTQADAIERFLFLGEDVTALTYAHYCAEILDAFVPESNHPSSELYAATLETLRRLGRRERDIAVRAFEMLLLDRSGYRPQLHSCLGCGKEIVPEKNYFSPALGGVICGDCMYQDPASVEISVPALKILRNLQTRPQEVLRLNRVEAALQGEMERRLHDYVVYHLERRPKSSRVLESLRTAPAIPA